MTPERWRRVEQLFEAALEKEPPQRESFLAEASAGDPALAEEVLRLIAADQKAGQYLSATRLTPSSRRGAPTGPIGQRLGPYRVLAEIGHGGMGTVYRAVRDDDQYQKQVAIKLVRGGMDSAGVIERFKAERQILADLEHPNIARLIDGGTTEEGWPYFSMEYVEGEALDRYCDSRQLSVTQRLELFRTVCSAVHYAHQRLVVHRDLKPSNILVDAQGTPKLLDFGIAKLLSADDGRGATATGMPMMTPEYASPEQVLGTTVTTATDVYSLGMILYELLSAQRAYQLKTRAPAEISEVVCKTEPPVPSSVAPRELARVLRGDLDTIVLKALRKEPARRYASVQELSEDIRRHLEGLPVLARGDATAYRAAKFVRRHKAGVAAVALVGLSLVGGIWATARQARIAEANRARAERRFNQVRQLATALLFKYHDGIAQLPGSTPVRQMLASDALEYLDNLSKESEGDVALLKELGAAYRRVARVQSSSNIGGVGDTAGAVKTYRKAQAIWEKIVALTPGDAENQVLLAGGYLEMGTTLTWSGQNQTRLELDRKALAILRSLADRFPENTKYRAEVARAYGSIADGSDSSEEKISNFKKAGSIFEELSATEPAYLRNAALNLKYLSSQVKRAGDPAAALEYARKALAIDERRAQAEPNNVETKLDVSFSRSQLGYSLLAIGDEEGALASFREALRLRSSVAEADPQNAHAKLAVAVAYPAIAEILVRRGQLADALENYLRSEELLDALAQKDPGNTDTASRAAKSYFDLGATYARLAADEKLPAGERVARWKTARSWLQRSADGCAKLGGPERLAAAYKELPETVAAELARCDAEIAKLAGTASR